MPQPGRSMLSSVQYHVQQWINLVLYNSIYQNVALLFLYRAFKFLYGFLDRSTELSRICDAHSPLDRLWDTEGNPVSALVHDKYGGTLAYTTSSPSIVSVAAGRRGSVQHSLLSTATTAESVATLVSDSNNSARTSTDSSSAASSPSDPEKNEEANGGLRRRQKKRGVSMSLDNNDVKMDLRQSKTAADMVYRVDRCILFSKQLTAERRELEAADCNAEQITLQILRKKRFPESGAPNT
ncbi:hypothetical protein BGZ93_011193 [Podila epicladia]|nr:hypothetical protein BGZ93_011193 [Podila epicladia]